MALNSLKQNAVLLGKHTVYIKYTVKKILHSDNQE